MTLIIACRCKDGIVLAADSQATLDSAAGPIKKKTFDKIFEITDGILFAGAGDVPIIQKIRKQIETLPQDIKENAKLEEIKEEICKRIHQVRRSMITKFRDLYGEVRGEKETPSAHFILAGHSVSGIPTIHRIDGDGLDEEENEYCAIGIGDAFAQITLKDIDTGSLDTDRVKPIVYKTILDAIETGAYGMGEPIAIWTIKNCPEKKCTKIGDLEINAVRDTVTTMRELMKEILIKNYSRDRKIKI